MDKGINTQAMELLQEIDCIDRNTLELKKDMQHKDCPFCGLDDGEYIENHQTKRALFFKYKKCNRCSLIYPYPRPNQEMIEGCFKTDDFSKQSEEAGRADEEHKRKDEEAPFFVKVLRSAWRKTPLIYSYQEFKKYAKKRDRILDIGAGLGNVAQKLIQKGCTVEAVELNPYRAKYLRETLRIKVHEGRLEDVRIEESSYDIVMFSQVLMHLFSVKATLEKVHRVLKSGGLLVSSQMNFNAIIQKTVRSPYPGGGVNAFTMPSCFTEESLRRILAMSGFKVLEVRYRPDSLFDYFFVGGYPGRVFARILLKGMDQILKIVQMMTGTANYFAVTAKKI